ncbi:MAG: DMP19 family protein [Arenimonas sp.]
MDRFDWPAASARIESDEGRTECEQLLWLLLHARVYIDEEGSGYARLSEPARDAWVIGLLTGELYNGGYHQYFSNSSGEHATETLDALRRVGAAALLDLHRRALQRFDPHGQVPEDRDERNRRLQALGPDEDASYEWFNALDQEFYALGPEHAPDTYAYALAHAGTLAFTECEWEVALEANPYLLFPADRQVTAIFDDDARLIRVASPEGTREYPLRSLRSLDIVKRKAAPGGSGLYYLFEFDDDIVRVPYFARGPDWSATPRWSFFPPRSHRIVRYADALAEARCDAPMESITLWVRAQGSSYL